MPKSVSVDGELEQLCAAAEVLEQEQSQLQEKKRAVNARIAWLEYLDSQGPAPEPAPEVEL